MPTDAVVLKSGRFEDIYEIKEEVGRGQFAVVHRVVRRRDGAEFAAKVMRKRSKASIDFNGVIKPAVEQEVRILLLLDHPNVIKLEEAYEEKHCFILVFELLKGGELFSKMLTRGRFSEAETVFYLREILNALEHLHSKSIVHLDIKPENVMLSDDLSANAVKIIDFGLSRLLNAKYVTRDMVGTPEFVAPEVINYDEITLATDMWSVGVLTYILLTGYSPFLGRSQQETYERVNEARCQLDGPQFHGVSDCARDFVRRLIRKSPKERQTVAQCLQHSWLTLPVPELLMSDIANQSNSVAQRLEISDSPSSGTSSPALTDRASIASGMSRNESISASMNHLSSTSTQPFDDDDDDGQSPSMIDVRMPSGPVSLPVATPAHHSKQPSSSSSSMPVTVPNSSQQQQQQQDEEKPRHRHHHHHHHQQSQQAQQQQQQQQQTPPSAGEQSPSSFLQARAARLRPSREPIVLLRPIPEQQSLLISARGNLRAAPGGSASSGGSGGSGVTRKSSKRQALAEQIKKLKPRQRSPISGGEADPDAPASPSSSSHHNQSKPTTTANNNNKKTLSSSSSASSPVEQVGANTHHQHHHNKVTKQSSGTTTGSNSQNKEPTAATSSRPGELAPGAAFALPLPPEPNNDLVRGVVGDDTVKSIRHLSLRIRTSPRSNKHQQQPVSQSHSPTSPQSPDSSVTIVADDEDFAAALDERVAAHCRQLRVIHGGPMSLSVDDISSATQSSHRKPPIMPPSLAKIGEQSQNNAKSGSNNTNTTKSHPHHKFFRLLSGGGTSTTEHATLSADRRRGQSSKQPQQLLSPSSPPTKRSNSPKDAALRSPPTFAVHSTDDDSSSAFESAASSAAFESLDNLAQHPSLIGSTVSSSHHHHNFSKAPMTSSLSHLHLLTSSTSSASGLKPLGSPNLGPSSGGSSSTTLSGGVVHLGHASNSTISGSSPGGNKRSNNNNNSENSGNSLSVSSAASRRQSGGSESSAMRLLRKLSGKHRKPQQQHQQQPTQTLNFSTPSSDEPEMPPSSSSNFNLTLSTSTSDTMATTTTGHSSLPLPASSTSTSSSASSSSVIPTRQQQQQPQRLSTNYSSLRRPNINQSSPSSSSQQATYDHYNNANTMMSNSMSLDPLTPTSDDDSNNNDTPTRLMAASMMVTTAGVDDFSSTHHHETDRRTSSTPTAEMMMMMASDHHHHQHHNQHHHHQQPQQQPSILRWLIGKVITK